MGHRITQRVFQCDVCDKTPDNGEYLWEMCGEHWCEDCCDNDHEADEIPLFEGTKEKLSSLGRMNLYLISQSVNRGYDTYDSAVVIAKDEDHARSIHPSEGESWNGKDRGLGYWANKEDVSVELIGVSGDTEAVVVIASFNAG